ncbi:MAG: phospholipase [Bacteroidales bacterium]|jgi:hypothetical protein|nr:phospholipase [Bacteroidales bacterium]
MDNIIFIICAVTLLLLFAFYYIVIWNKRRNNNQTNSVITKDKVAQTGGNPSGCCGKHIVCEKLDLKSNDKNYFDDEELDRFHGRSSDSYTEIEVEEFRYVLYTMRQEEVRDWVGCLQIREVELPDQLKEECISMMNEIL